jgi:hypothetical protein
LKLTNINKLIFSQVEYKIDGTPSDMKKNGNEYINNIYFLSFFAEKIKVLSFHHLYLLKEEDIYLDFYDKNLIGLSQKTTELILPT